MEMSDIAWIVPIIISIIALIVAILKYRSDRQSSMKQSKANKKMLDTQLKTQRALVQKQIQSQKESLEKQLQLQKEAIEKQMLVQREIFEKQIKAQQELIGILKKQLTILETGLKEIKENKRPSDWERQYKQQELELKQKKEAWKQMKDLAGLAQYLFEE